MVLLWNTLFYGLIFNVITKFNVENRYGCMIIVGVFQLFSIVTLLSLVMTIYGGIVLLWQFWFLQFLIIPYIVLKDELRFLRIFIFLFFALALGSIVGGSDFQHFCICLWHDSRRHMCNTCVTFDKMSWNG